MGAACLARGSNFFQERLWNVLAREHRAFASQGHICITRWNEPDMEPRPATPHRTTPPPRGPARGPAKSATPNQAPREAGRLSTAPPGHVATCTCTQPRQGGHTLYPYAPL